MFDICKRSSNFSKVAKILKAAPDCKIAAHQLAAYAVKQVKPELAFWRIQPRVG
jgi:hypothetical protein